MSSPVARLRSAAQRLHDEVEALAVACRDPRVPRAARVVLVLTVAYALSPVDLIPDVIPVLGLLDDLVVVPVGVWVALRLVPDGVMEDARARVGEDAAGVMGLRQAGFRIVLGLWTLLVVLAWVAVA